SLRISGITIGRTIVSVPIMFGETRISRHGVRSSGPVTDDSNHSFRLHDRTGDHVPRFVREDTPRRSVRPRYASNRPTEARCWTADAAASTSGYRYRASSTHWQTRPRA